MRISVLPARLLLGFSLAVVLLGSSCQKKEIQGPKGDPGTPGGGGNSTINTSQVFTIPGSNWQSNADSSAWVINVNSELVTQAVADAGAVKIYIKRNTTWWELPFTEGDLFMQFGFMSGKVHLTFVDIHGGLPERPETAEFRLVVISESSRPVNSKDNQTTPVKLAGAHTLQILD